MDLLRDIPPTALIVSGIFDEVLLRLVLYAAICIPTMLYLRRKEAPGNLQVTVFVLITAVFIISLFHRPGLFSQLVEVDSGFPYLLPLLVLLPLAVMGFFAYKFRLLGAFSFFVALVLVIFSYPFLIDITHSQQMGASSRRYLDYGWFLLCLILGAGAMIQLMRGVLKRWPAGS